MRRFVAAAWLLAAVPAVAQVSGTSLLLAQSGNRLYTSPSDRLDGYLQVDLVYARKGFSAGGRFESDHTSEDQPGAREAQYDVFTRRWAQLEESHARLRAGHFNTILGRGLIHRSYELPGVVYDEPGTRTRYAATRDVDGVLGEAWAGPLSVRAFQGRPSDGTVSPASELQGAPRYAGVLSGAQAELAFPWSARVGLATARYAFRSAPVRNFGTAFVALDPLAAAGVRGVSAPLYLEYAQRDGAFGDGLRLRRGPETPHALYASANVLWGRWSLAGEYKDYDQFRTGLNDPPPLVREHSAVLPNRATHVLDAEGEEGFQLELLAPVHEWVNLVANLSRSDGSPLTANARFEERFAEVTLAPPGAEPWSVRAFLSRGFDRFEFIGERRAAGVGGSCAVRPDWSLEWEVEHQRSLRVGFGGFRDPFDDDLVTLGVSRAGWGSAGVTVTRTTDLLDRPSDLFGNATAPSATFAGVTLAADPAEGSHVELFAGRRRGGRACVSGTCYEVPSLSGVEFRWVGRF